jgi:disulfide bond formation protein DsbB
MPAMETPPSRPAEHSISIWLALIAAAAASIGSVWLSFGMELKACPLCLYQRACVFCTAAILLIGIMLRKQESAAIGALSLAPATAALAIGIYHVYLERTGVLECPAGIWNIGTAPQQALAAEAAISLMLLAAAIRRWLATTMAIILGVALALFMIRTAPPMPPKPTMPYSSKPDVCRQPFRPPASS